MIILNRAILYRVGQVLSAAATLLTASSVAMASDRVGATSDPDVINPKRFSDDVSAFYLGLTAGYGFGGDDRFGLDTPADRFEIGDQDLSGAYGGVRGGWRGVLPAEAGRDFVYGFEIGYDFASIEDNVTTLVGSETVQGGSEISDILSVRFRSGITNRTGRVLYFYSLGYVQGDVETTNSISSGGTTRTFQENDRRSGFSASVGAERYLTENWSITGEYEYVRFQSEDVRFTSGFSTKSTPLYHGFRFGLNYKF